MGMSRFVFLLSLEQVLALKEELECETELSIS